LSKENFKEKEKLVAGPRWVPDTKTDWLTVGPNLTSTFHQKTVTLKIIEMYAETLQNRQHLTGRDNDSYGEYMELLI
jgi:hypothetical protein